MAMSRKHKAWERVRHDLEMLGLLDDKICLDDSFPRHPRERGILDALVDLERADLPLDAIYAIGRLLLAAVTRALDVPTDEPCISGARKRLLGKK